MDRSTAASDAGEWSVHVMASCAKHRMRRSQYERERESDDLNNASCDV